MLRLSFCPVALLTSRRLLPEELIQQLLELSPTALSAEPFGSLLLMVRSPAKAPREFSAPLEQWALRGAARPSLPGTVVTTAEIPTVNVDGDAELAADQIGLLAELESSEHCVVPLPRSASPLRVGRSKDNDIVLGDDSVSHAHAEIQTDEDGVALVDLHSKNGTWVGGTRLTAGAPRWLQPMDRLQFGRIQAFTCLPGVLRGILRHELRSLF
jgi:hypothetical protein